MVVAENSPNSKILNNRFYLYEHRRVDTNELIYIGKGTKYRYTSVHGRNKYHKNIINSVGIYAKIISENLTNKEAYELEVSLISFAKSMGYNLVNISTGGEAGSVGVKFTDERRAKISGDNNWLFKNGQAIRDIKNPNHRYEYRTPAGIFTDRHEAAKANNLKVGTLYYRCRTSSKKCSAYSLRKVGL